MKERKQAERERRAIEQQRRKEEREAHKHVEKKKHMDIWEYDYHHQNRCY